MKYYCVQLADHEIALQTSRLNNCNNGSIEFWLDISKEDDSAHYGREYGTKLVAMYPSGYWVSVYEVDEQAFNAFTAELENEPEGGLQ
jgi:hypothetical protein